MDNYKENAVIIQVDKNEITYEENLIIEVNAFKLKCFISNFITKGDFEKEEIVEVQLSLMTTEHEKTDSNKKNIISTDIFENHCVLSGEIKKIVPRIVNYYDEKTGSYYAEPTDYNHGIVDCGIHVLVEIPKDSNLKIGDYIKAEGRLDVQKVEK